MGAEANREISRLSNTQDEEIFPVGWGSNIASRGQFPGGTWIGLPHLSRFTIMGREASRQALDLLFDGVNVR